MKLALNLTLALTVTATAGCFRPQTGPVPKNPTVLSGKELKTTPSSNPSIKSTFTYPQDLKKLEMASPDDKIDEYQKLVTKCEKALSQYYQNSGDALDHAANIRDTYNAVVALLTGGSGVVSGTTSDLTTAKAAGWSAAGTAVVGLIIGYVVAPGDRGLEARNKRASAIVSNESDFDNFLKSVSSNDPAKWTPSENATFATLFGKLDGACSVTF